MNRYVIFTFLFIALIAISRSDAEGQSYTLIIANKKIINSEVLEFDIIISTDSPGVLLPLKFFQSGYSLSRGFVNGGFLTAQYVPGSSDLEAAFGKTWGFSFNQSLCVLNQSANIGSVCPGALIGNNERRIGRFRVTNTVKWGCDDDSLDFLLSGTGHLNLALARYKTADCTDPGSLLCTADAYVQRLGNNLKLKASVEIMEDDNNCDSMAILKVSAFGGLSPYEGIGDYACTNGYYQFSVRDGRGCLVTTDTVLSMRSIAYYWYDSACEKYVLPWGDTVINSGIYSHRFISSGGCDSMVHADIQISRQHVAQEYLTICKQQLPWSWKGKLLPASGDYEMAVSAAAGCDSIFRIRLVVDSVPVLTDNISGISAGLCQQKQVAFRTPQSPNIGHYLWQVPQGAVVTSGQGSSGITVDFSGALTDGEVCATPSNGCGSGKKYCLPISLKPFMISGISGLNQVKRGQKLYYGASAYGATSYSWVVPAGWQIISGQGSDKIYVRTGPQAGNISVTARNACGLSETISRQIGMAMARSSRLAIQYAELNIRAGNQLIGFPIGEDDVIKEIRLLDIAGRILQVFKQATKIEITGFLPGSYIVQVITQEAHFSRPILIR